MKFSLMDFNQMLVEQGDGTVSGSRQESPLESGSGRSFVLVLARVCWGVCLYSSERLEASLTAAPFWCQPPLFVPSCTSVVLTADMELLQFMLRSCPECGYDNSLGLDGVGLKPGSLNY